MARRSAWAARRCANKLARSSPRRPRWSSACCRWPETRADDLVIDLGSGDGRIVIAAARKFARGLGIELDGALVEKSRENARAAKVADRASQQGDVLPRTFPGRAS